MMISSSPVAIIPRINRQQQQQQQQPDNSKGIEALTSQVEELKETVNILITQITMLRGELKKH